jgi:hypothetical protein
MTSGNCAMSINQTPDRKWIVYIVTSADMEKENEPGVLSFVSGRRLFLSRQRFHYVSGAIDPAPRLIRQASNRS